jgi:uncharacterized membrane protein
MNRLERSIDVHVPVRVAYDQWTQFEDFPRFMEGVQRVVQLTDKTLAWTAEIGGQRREWTAEIVDQTPDTRVAWRSTSGERNDGAVLFEALADGGTRIVLRMEVEPDGPVETIGTALGFLDRRIQGDLERFKEFVENRGSATGAWRGEIHGDEVEVPQR